MGTRHRGRPEEVLALDTYIKLVRAAEWVTSRLHRTTASGLTITQFGALEALYHLGPMCQIDLGHKVLKSGGNMTMVIDNLEKRGLAARQRDPADRRRMIVHLTEAGRRLMEELFPRHAANIREAMSPLGPEEQQTLGRLCRKLGLALAGDGTVATRQQAADEPAGERTA